MPQWALVTYCCLILLMGLRDKVVFLSARSEQYVPTMLYFGLFAQLPRHDHRRQDRHRRDLDGRRLLEAAARLLVDRVDHGAEHAVDGVPAVPQGDGQGLPERPPAIEAHARPGPHRWHHLRDGDAARAVVLAVAVADVDRASSRSGCCTRFIISTIPLAVPLEWNVFFMFVVAFLFANFPAGERVRRRRHDSVPAGDRDRASPSPRSSSVHCGRSTSRSSSG